MGERAGKDDVHVEVLKLEDREEVMKIIRPAHYMEEPMSKYLNVGEGCPEYDAFVTKYLGADSSFKAVNSRGQIVGVYFNGIVRRGDKYYIAPKCKHPFGKIVDFLKYASEQFNIFDLYPDVDQYLYHEVLSVLPEYRRSGVANQLLYHTTQYIKKHGIDLAVADCTSAYSAHSSERAGYTKIYELPYADYVVDGERPFLLDPPHTSLRTYAKRHA